MLKPILVPLDGSTLDERALNYASLLARETGSALHLVRAVPLPAAAHYSGAESLWLAVAQQREDRLDATAALARVASRMRRLGHDVRTSIRFGRPSDVILETSRDQDAALVVLATRGRRGLARWWEGSVADEVVRWADAPILLVREWDKPSWSTSRPMRLMVGLDGSTFAEAVLEPTVELANALSADVVLARVVTPPTLLDEARGNARSQEEEAVAGAQAYLASVASKLPVAGQAATHVQVGRAPTAGLERLARDERVHLVALATHGRGGLARVAMGSTATTMLERSPVPLLLLRPAGASDLAADDVLVRTRPSLAPAAI
jgi:nucleotide-binding universal stress UspA family protein